MNALSWLAGFPNRVGVPKSTASAHSRSPCAASVMWAVSWRCRSHSGRAPTASGGAVSATLRSRTSAPAFSAPPAAARARACTVPVEL